MKFILKFILLFIGAGLLVLTLIKPLSSPFLVEDAAIMIFGFLSLLGSLVISIDQKFKKEL